MSLTVDVGSAGEVVRVVVAGEIDYTNVGMLRDGLARAGTLAGRQIDVDLSHVPFMDSVGIAVLLGAYSAGQRTGVSVLITVVHPALYPILQITGILPLFGVQGAPPVVEGSAGGYE